MTDFEKRIPDDDTIVEDWPEPEDYEDEDDWDDYADADGPKDYEVKFKLLGATDAEVNTVSRYLFDAIIKELSISPDKLKLLELGED